MIQTSLGFGITGATDGVKVREIAQRAEELGISTLWINDTPGGDALEKLAVAATVTSRLHLASGVISVDRRPADQIVAAVRARKLPLDRLTIGIGSAARPGALRRVADSLEQLHAELEVGTVVGSLGPRMRRLGAERSNGLLFNWLPPGFAAETTSLMRQQASEAGNAPVMAATYIRTAMGKDALPRLKEEAARYGAIPAYAANFERLGITAMDSAVFAETAEGVRQGIAAFDGAVDHAVVRAITATETLDEYLRLLDAIAPLAQRERV
jgi:alkanesulfonate monooxygenase SsuD/methylene tetrahydromethanopterin reductase-like flavin-dependent oxidoreductase (luciferase family)